MSKKAKTNTPKSARALAKKQPHTRPAVARFAKLPKRLVFLVASSLLVIAAAAMMSMAVFHAKADSYQRSVGRVVYAKSMYDVADALSTRPGSTLVLSQGMLTVLHPTLNHKQQTFTLNTCPAINDAVMQQLQKHSIAVLVHVHNEPGAHQCTLAQIVTAYGRPNASTTLAGSLENPTEVLLYYDNGPLESGPLKPISPPQAPATVVPITLATLPKPSCAHRTLLNVVAHQDDDLLFMNPDLLHAVRSGDCLRTIYLTAGDDGLRSTYWLGREKGAEAAYDYMAGRGASVWLERYVTVNSHEYVKMASPRGNTNITLIFVHLPDGNVPGTGFLRNRYQSIAKLADGSAATISSVDGQSHYTKAELTDVLVQLMQLYSPNQINTQTPLNVSTAAVEHSDHMTAGQFAAAAATTYGKAPISYYTGYPISLLSANVSAQDQADKSAAFYAYVPHDTQVCLNPADCAPSGPYASWIQRQYAYTPGDPLIAPPAATSNETTPQPDTDTSGGSN